MAPASKRPVHRAYVILAVLGWVAAGFSIWYQSIGHESPQPAPVAQGEDREKAETGVDATQQKLATAQSALAATIRLRDEAAQALQEVRERSAGANKDLAAARSELDEIRQKIAAQSSELATLTTRLDTARLRESQVKKPPDASARRVATKTPATGATAAASPPPPASAASLPAAATAVRESSAAANKDLAAARGKLDDIRQEIAARSSELAAITRRLDTARSDESQRKKQADARPTAIGAIQPAPVQPLETPPKSIDRNASPIAQTSPPDAKPSPETTPDSSPAPDRNARNLSNSSGPVAVIGPGASSYPSDFELHSGRISRTP
jgi:hypothetical protein